MLTSVAALLDENSYEQMNLLVDAVGIASKIQNTKVLFTIARYVSERFIQDKFHFSQHAFSNVKFKLASLRDDINLKGEREIAKLIDAATKQISTNDNLIFVSKAEQSETTHTDLVHASNRNTVTAIVGPSSDLLTADRNSLLREYLEWQSLCAEDRC